MSPDKIFKKNTVGSLADNRSVLLGIQIGPLSFWLISFLIIPLLVIIYYSFCQKTAGGGIEHIFSLRLVYYIDYNNIKSLLKKKNT